MKLAALIAAVVGIIFLCSAWSAAAEVKKKRTTSRIASPKKIQELRAILIERKKASRDSLKNSLPYYEEKLAGQAADYETKQTLYMGKLISRQELENSERALIHARQEAEHIRQRIAEDDVALSLAAESAEEAMERLPNIPPGGYAETATLIRYNGTASWSRADAGRIAKFFRSRFGYRLPVSAMGQSSMHDRMGFDHRDAVDVAVTPDSVEGRGLMEYLRKANIPFLAFRGKIPNTSTGAHIHIGRPSPRLMEVKHRANPGPAPDHRERAIELTSGGH